MTRPRSEERVIRRFTSAQWDGQQGPGSINIFAKLRARWVLLGLIIFVVLANLGAFGAVVIVMGVVILGVKTLSAASKSSPRQKFVTDLMADVNETIIELTGDPNASLSVDDLRTLAQKGQPLPLPVNGVPGLDLRVVSDRPGEDRVAAIARVDDTVRTTRIIVTATAPDYATASFDRLLQATVAAGPERTDRK
jgi:hypothetical protein